MKLCLIKAIYHIHEVQINGVFYVLSWFEQVRNYGENCLLIVLFIAPKKFAFNFNYFSGILPVDVLFCLLEFVPKIF